jgi:hypothetical protein
MVRLFNKALNLWYSNSIKEIKFKVRLPCFGAHQKLATVSAPTTVLVEPLVVFLPLSFEVVLLAGFADRNTEQRVTDVGFL